jgi:hypothetical protein
MRDKWFLIERSLFSQTFATQPHLNGEEGFMNGVTVGLLSKYNYYFYQTPPVLQHNRNWYFTAVLF